jgi:YjbE family integral membrane protein
MEWLPPQLVGLIQVIVIDIVLASDNAIVVGIAASRVHPDLRPKVILWGVAGAVVLRIFFAAITTQLLAIVGLTLAGGILLLWVCWKMYRELNPPAPKRSSVGAEAVTEEEAAHDGVSFWRAVTTIIAADISMSLDNVLAVAGAAKGDIWVLVIGLTIAIVLMAVAANYLAKLLVRYPAITWIGLAVIFYVALDMMWRGTHEVLCLYLPQAVCSEGLVASVTALLQ